MNAQKIAFFIFAFIIAGGIVNGSGIFTVKVDTPDADTPGAELADGITEIGSDVSSSSDLGSAFDSWAMVKSLMSSIGTLFVVLVIPGPYLASIGVPVLFAYGIQSMVTITEIWGLIQILTGRSTKGMD